MRKGALRFTIAETVRHIAKLGGDPGLATDVFNALAQRNPAILECHSWKTSAWKVSNVAPSRQASDGRPAFCER